MSTTLPAITALGTRWFIEVFTDTLDVASVHTDILSYITRYEHRYSRFLQSSLVSMLNQHGTLENPDQECVDILAYGKSLYTKTNGTFNILVGAELSARGYNSAYTFTPEQATRSDIIPSPLSALTITSEQISLTAGGLDLGGFGKGYLVDLVAKRLQTVHGLEFFLINAGGDMFATSNHGQPIAIYLEHPHDSTMSIYTSSLYNQGFAASSTNKRSWTYNGTTHTHLVATTNSVDDLDTVASYVFAQSATGADVLATTTLLSSQPATEFIAEEAAIIARYDTTNNELTSSAPLPKPVV